MIPTILETTIRMSR